MNTIVALGELHIVECGVLNLVTHNAIVRGLGDVYATNGCAIHLAQHNAVWASRASLAIWIDKVVAVDHSIARNGDIAHTLCKDKRAIPILGVGNLVLHKVVAKTLVWLVVVQIERGYQLGTLGKA